MLQTTRTDVRSPEAIQRPARPPRPEGLRQVELSENARTARTKRYLRRGDDGAPIESIEDMFWRVAWHIAEAESEWGGDVLAGGRRFYELLASKSFFPNSPTFTGAGTPLGQLAACFVLPITDDMGRDSGGVFPPGRTPRSDRAPSRCPSGKAPVRRGETAGTMSARGRG